MRWPETARFLVSGATRVARNTGPGVPRREPRRLARRLVGRGGGAGRAARERPPRPRDPQGRGVRDPGADDARMGALRLRPRPRRRRRRGDLRQLVAAGRQLHPRALGGRRRALRGRRAAGESVRATGAPARAHLRGSPCARGGGPRLPRGESRRARRSGGGDRRGGSLHVHLHVGHDRAAQGVHDPAPELLRDGRRRRRAAGLQRCRATSCSSTCRSLTTSAG